MKARVKKKLIFCRNSLKLLSPGLNSEAYYMKRVRGGHLVLMEIFIKAFCLFSSSLAS